MEIKIISTGLFSYATFELIRIIFVNLLTHGGQNGVNIHTLGYNTNTEK